MVPEKIFRASAFNVLTKLKIFFCFDLFFQFEAADLKRFGKKRSSVM